MTRPLLLDLFSGAGGSAMGYHRAGFDVVGVDHRPQPRYPFPFIRGDAIETATVVLRDGFDGRAVAAIHASPPCQAFSTIAKQRRQTTPEHRFHHPDMVDATRAVLRAAGLPYIIENVVGAPLIDPVLVCGSSLGLDVRRHRLFESNVALMVPPCVHGWQTPRFPSIDKRRGPKRVVPVYSGGRQLGYGPAVTVAGHLNYPGERALRERAMEIDWMNTYELTQAIPPAYTELLGHQLIGHVRNDNGHPRGGAR